jgi:hypothetical protein
MGTPVKTCLSIFGVILAGLSVSPAAPSANHGPVPTLVSPTIFPITLAPKKKLNVSYTATIDCPNDPLSDLGHEDCRTTVTLNHAALDGQADTVPANDICPRPPNPATGDKGCATGLEVRTDVFLKQ